MRNTFCTTAGKATVFLGCLLLAGAAAAQSDAQITLSAKAGNTTITGDLISFENGVYEIETMAGRMNIDATAVDCAGANCPPLFVMDAPIVLTTLDGEVMLSGAMRGLDDGQFLIQTASLGTVEIAADLVNCDGPGCPIGM